MNPAGRGRALVALAVLVPVSFALLVHASLVRGVPPSLGAALSLIPLSLLAFFAIRRSRHRGAALALAAVGIAVVWLAWPQVQSHYSNLFFLEHAAANLLLAYVFGSTLRAGQEPLVTRFARMVHGHLPPEVEAYARRVTLAWTLFFLAMLTASCVLFVGGWIQAWSLLANIVGPILVVLGFVVEYIVRHRVLPDWERVGILGGVRAFLRHMQATPYQPSR